MQNLSHVDHIAPAGHPLYTLMEEHHILLELANQLVNIASRMRTVNDFSSAQPHLTELKQVVAPFRESQPHYLREENVIFPYCDKHGFSGPPAVMWNEHNQIRDIEKALFQLMDGVDKTPYKDFVAKLNQVAGQQQQMLTNHFFKENNILFPTALELITEEEWQTARTEFDKIGYCPFTPASAKPSGGAQIEAGPPESAAALTFDTGVLTKEQIEAIFNNLPVEITFIDQDDTLRFFSQPKDTIFTRSTAALGLKVQNCHPAKSIHVVNQILAEFKAGKREVATFWINLAGKYVYIRYFPVRDKQGNYLGCMEVTQDIKDLKKVEGEKKLL